jgi:hypothetical protein
MSMNKNGPQVSKVGCGTGDARHLAGFQLAHGFAAIKGTALRRSPIVWLRADASACARLISTS